MKLLPPLFHSCTSLSKFLFLPYLPLYWGLPKSTNSSSPSSCSPWILLLSSSLSGGQNPIRTESKNITLLSELPQQYGYAGDFQTQRIISFSPIILLTLLGVFHCLRVKILLGRGRKWSALHAPRNRRPARQPWSGRAAPRGDEWWLPSRWEELKSVAAVTDKSRCATFSMITKTGKTNDRTDEYHQKKTLQNTSQPDKSDWMKSLQA